MPQCASCKRSGILIALNRNNVCRDCAPQVGFEIQDLIRQANLCLDRASSSAKGSQAVAWMSQHIETVRKLADLNARGIDTGVRNLDKQISDALLERDRALIRMSKEAVDKAVTKVETSASAKSKATALSSAIVKIVENKNLLTKAGGLDALERETRERLRQVQLDGFLEAAQKAEFMGQMKKALDQLREALYFIKTDQVDDAQQSGVIQVIQAKIDELQSAQKK